MQQSVQQKSGLPLGQRCWRALVKLDFISNFFTWTMELLARVTEPLASVSAIYIIICAGVPVLLVGPLYNLALALIIGSPELLVVGAFKIASRELNHGNKRGGWLMAACIVLLLLTALTVGDLFIWHWGTAVVSVLMGCRCLAGIAYTFTRGIVTDDSELDVSQGSPVHTLLQEFTANMTANVLETVNLARQQMLTEVNQMSQSTLAEVNRIALEMNRRQQQLLAEFNGVNQSVQVELQAAIEVLGQQSQQALDAAVERLERSNSRRLETVYTRLEQVRVTLESNPNLPAVNPSPTRLRLPGRNVHQVAENQATMERSPINVEEANRESEPIAGGAKVDQGRAFTVNHFRDHGTLPTLGMIMAAAVCSKTLASRIRGLAAQELGLKVNAGE